MRSMLQLLDNRNWHHMKGDSEHIGGALFRMLEHSRTPELLGFWGGIWSFPCSSFNTDASDVVLDPNSAHPKLIISPEGDSVTYTDTWQEVPENVSRFDTTLNAVSQDGFMEGRHYWEVQVAGKTYWELGLTYPSIPRKGREEHCWLGRGADSWCVEFFNGSYNAWHRGVAHALTHVEGRSFTRIGVFSSSPGGLVCFLGADTMTPLYCFCAGTFTDKLLQAVCPGHDNQGTNWVPLQICDASRSGPTLWWTGCWPETLAVSDLCPENRVVLLTIKTAFGVYSALVWLLTPVCSTTAFFIVLGLKRKKLSTPWTALILLLKSTYLQSVVLVELSNLMKGTVLYVWSRNHHGAQVLYWKGASVEFPKSSPLQM